MRTLVIGKGGREHAIVRALNHSPSIDEVHCLPGSPGIEEQALCHSVETSNFEGVLEVVKKCNIDFVVIGPEAEIEMGLSDFLRKNSIPVVAPSKEAGQLESSKIYSKHFMKDAGVPTAEFYEVNSVESCLEAAKNFNAPYVLKADGLAAGKGVFICKTLDELTDAAKSLFEENTLGDAGKKALLEKFQEGWELSFLILTNGIEYKPLPLSQDHKRLLVNDEGPNTGGMGVVCPLRIDIELEERIHNEILAPSVSELAKKNLLYRGILYVGVMVTKDGPTTLEYNVRFGDPEAQVVLPLLNGDWGETFKALAKGELTDLNWKPLSATCVVLAAEGYPVKPVKGSQIQGDVNFSSPSSYFLHAGTGKDDQGEWTTSGGRVLNAIGIGSNLKESVQLAYEQAKKVNWPGCQLRTDIGAKQL